MTARPRKTAPAAPVAPAAAPAAPTAPSAPRVDLAALAGGAKAVKVLPPRPTRSGSRNPFVALVGQSRDKGTPMALAPISDEAVVKTAVGAIRRAAASLGLGVSVRQETTAAGTVITFEPKTKAAK